jgi:hypothetical protein
MKEKLSQKIDSKEKFQQLIEPHTCGRGYMSGADFYGPLGVDVTNHMWWATREKLRLMHEFYEVSPILAKLNHHMAGQHFVHISRQDRTRVALTMSTRDGEEDRQTIMTFGKYLRKYYLLLTDAQIALIEAEHRSYIEAELLFARTAEDIERVYTTMLGDSGCMRYGRSGFTGAQPLNAHPSAVYEAPGMAVAYTQDTEGRVKSRSVVWVNPSDANDKRYVRTYGDAQLIDKLLTKEGYKARDLVGAKLRAIPLVTDGEVEEGRYVMPYLDGVKGDQQKPNGTYGILTGDGYVKLLTIDEAHRLNSLQYDTAVRLKLTSGVMAMKLMPDMSYTSELTGMVWSLLDSGKVKVWHEGRVVTAALIEVRDSYKTVKIKTQDSVVLAYVPNTLPTFYGGSATWLDSPEARLYCGMVRLDPVLYPEASSWLSVSGVCSLPDGRYIAKRDAIQVYPETGDSYIVHESQMVALRKAGHIKCYSDGPVAAMIHKKRASLRKTESGTVFDLTDTGAFRKLTFPVSEVWVGPRSYYYFELFNNTGCIRKGENVLSFSADVLETLITSSQHTQRFREDLATLERGQLQRNLDIAVKKALKSNRNIKYYQLREDGSVEHDYYNFVDTLDKLKAIVPKLEEGTYIHANVYRAVLNAMLKLEAEWELLHFNDVAVLPETETI